MTTLAWVAVAYGVFLLAALFLAWGLCLAARAGDDTAQTALMDSERREFPIAGDLAPYGGRRDWPGIDADTPREFTMPDPWVAK